jgi:hypothetical protein
MKLSAQDRLILLAILPREGSIADIRVITELRAALSFSEEEHAVLQIHQDGKDGITWNQEADKPIEIQVGARATAIVKDTFEKLDAAKKMRDSFLPLYDRFVEGETVDATQ